MCVILGTGIASYAADKTDHEYGMPSKISFGEVTDTQENDSYFFGVGGAVHAARQFDNYLLGGFTGYVFTAQDEDRTATSGRAFVGLEAQRYFEDTTLYSRLGWLGGDWGNDDEGEDSLSKLVFGRTMVR